MRINIRHFHFSHFNELIKMLQELRVFYPTFSNLDSIYKEFIYKKNLYCIAAISENELVGFGSIFIFQRVRGCKRAMIKNLTVSEINRKLEIGSKVLKNLISKAKVQKWYKINLESNIQSGLFYV